MREVFFLWPAQDGRTSPLVFGIEGDPTVT